MQYDVTTPQEYLEKLEDDWRKEKLQQIRDMILSKAPDLMEGIMYKMLSYGDHSKAIFGLNAQKNYVSLYIGDLKKVDNSDLLLNGLDIGKGCIRIKKSNKIEQTGLEKFIEQTVGIWRAGGDTSC